MKLKQAKLKARLLAILSKRCYGVAEICDIHRPKGALKDYVVRKPEKVPAADKAFEDLLFFFYPDGSMRDSKFRLLEADGTLHISARDILKKSHWRTK
jgi:hypothetical protein